MKDGSTISSTVLFDVVVVAYASPACRIGSPPLTFGRCYKRTKKFLSVLLENVVIFLSWKVIYGKGKR